MSKYFCFLFALIACCLNLVLLSSVVFLLVLFQFLWMQLIRLFGITCDQKTFISRWIDVLIGLHSKHIRLILTRVCGVQFDCFLPRDLSMDTSYVMVVNHRSHVDILVILAVFYDRVPDVKFFLKQSLLWVPFMGQFCYLMNYVFVKSVRSHQVRKNPTIVMQQREHIREQCRFLVQDPVTLAIFAEGTRYSEDKAGEAAQGRFKHLLAPQPAGVALALEASVPCVKYLLDVTLVYDVNFVSVWLLLSGQVRTIEVHAQAHGVDDQQLAGDYILDRRFRKRFTAWMKSLWEKKDALLIQSLMRFRRGKVSPVSH